MDCFIPVANDHLFTVLHYHHLRSSITSFEASYWLSYRLQTELMQLMTSSAPGISAFPSADGNLLSWTATIEGPDDTPYAGLTFKLSFAFPSNYPYAAPTVLFKTPIYHPNVDFSGRICLDILKDKWTAAYNIQTVLLSLQSLLGEPNKWVYDTEPIIRKKKTNRIQCFPLEWRGCWTLG